jgi:hypothetical protein
MRVVNDERFIKGVESLIEPMEVSRLLAFQVLRKLLPASLMKRLLFRASKNTPYIGFVIEPYSLFLFFRLKDIERAKSMLPERYELAKTRIFADEEPDYYLGIGNLSTRASTFWGVRQESYLIARDTVTGLLCWIFIDILSNTIIAVPNTGLADANTAKALFTTSPRGQIYLDVEEKRSSRRLSLSASVTNGRLRNLDEPIWVMGNTSIGHSKAMADGDDVPFAVIFDPAEVEAGLDIPLGDVAISENSLFPGLAEPELAKAICFPFAQHYIADSPGCHTPVKDPAELVTKYEELAAKPVHATFSAGTIIRQLWLGVAVTVVVTLGVYFLG